MLMVSFFRLGTPLSIVKFVILCTVSSQNIIHTISTAWSEFIPGTAHDTSGHFIVNLVPQFFVVELIICITFPDKPREGQHN
jgi:hypothetical protein